MTQRSAHPHRRDGSGAMAILCDPPALSPLKRARISGWVSLCRARVDSASPVPSMSGLHSDEPSPAESPLRSRWGEIFGPLAFRLATVAFTLAILLLPLGAEAVELYSDPCCIASPPPPQPVLYQPVLYTPPAKVVHVSNPTPVVVVESTTTVEVEDTPEVKAKKKVLTLVEGRGGAGMWIIPGLREDVHLGYNLDLALAMRGFLVGLDFTWIHGIEWTKQVEEQDCLQKSNLAIVGMKLGYRFNEDGRVHPELSARFDTLVLDSKSEDTKLAFGIGGSAALIADFPLKYGAIVVGLEVAGHRHVWAQNGFYPPRASVAVMGSLGYKF